MPSISPSPGPRWRRYAALVVLALAAVGAGWMWLRPSGPVPPSPTEAEMEPAVSRAVRVARDRVLDKPRSAVAWGELGEIFFANELEDEALICFQQADKLDPKSDLWPSLLTMILINRGDRDAALPILERAISNGRGEASVVRRLVLVEQLLLLGRAAEAEPHLREAAARMPDDPRVRYDNALLAIAQRDLAKARTLLEASRESPYTQKRARVQLAVVYLRLGEEQLAAKCQAESDRLAADVEWPDPVVAKYKARAVKRREVLRIADDLATAGQFADALRLLEPVGKEFPDDVVVQLMLGRLKTKMGDFEGGEAAVRRAGQLDPDKVQVHYYLSLVLLEKGTMLARQGEKERARASFQGAVDAANRAIELKSDYGFAHHYKAQALKHLGKLKEAAAALEKAVACTPDQGEIRVELADALVSLHRPAEAIVQLEQAIVLAPPNATWLETARNRLAELKIK
ncbi:MAG TPA: tetratricopeptide repeat protein [Urbifossiella sp.]|nr:tetratricopeptide repeat protein [Urbifossiella sp.]